MYLWNIRALKEAIRSGALTERAQFMYLLMWIVFFPLLGQIAFVSSAGWVWTLPEIASLGVAWAIFLIGICAAYIFNGGREGSGFADKFMSIGFVVFVRFVPIAIIAMIISAVISVGVYGPFVEDADFRMTWIDAVVMSVIYGWYMWRVAVHVRDVR